MSSPLTPIRAPAGWCITAAARTLNPTTDQREAGFTASGKSRRVLAVM